MVDYKGINKEEVEGGKITALSQVRVTCRNRTDINEQQRIIWMNPPYSNPRPWIDRWLKHGNGVALIPFAKSAWFVQLWERSNVALTYVHDMNRASLNFERNGTEAQIFQPVCAAAIGSTSITALHKLGKVR